LLDNWFNICELNGVLTIIDTIPFASWASVRKEAVMAARIVVLVPFSSEKAEQLRLRRNQNACYYVNKEQLNK